MNNKLICIAGPTASGKTAFSIALAKKLDGEIISADSMQIYKQMNIGTAKPSKEEMQGIPHYLIDEISPFCDFNVKIFVDKAKEYIDFIKKRNKLPIVVGGTGLFISSLIDNVSFYEGENDEKLREELSKLAQDKGNEYLHNMLKEIDECAANLIHPNNVKRVIRAIEAFKTTGVQFSKQKELSRQNKSDYDLTYFGLTMERAILYERIDKRVDIMLENGLLEEVQSLYEGGLNLDYKSMQGIGYKELILYLEKKMTLDEAIDKIKQESRRYAKRQLTWFRRDVRINWIDSYETNLETMINNAIKIIKI